MLNELKNEANRAYTENGALTNRSTHSDCLDLFATVGALRRQSEDEIIARFTRAFSENRDLAVKTLFYARDVRGGLGERRVFRVIIGWLAQNEPATLKKNIKYFAEYGRFDDLLCLLHTKCEGEAVRVIKEQLDKDMSSLNKGEDVSLLAKWLPSENTSSKTARENARYLMQKLGCTERRYRKTLVALRAKIRIIENNLIDKPRFLWIIRDMIIRHEAGYGHRSVVKTNIRNVYNGSTRLFRRKGAVCFYFTKRKGSVSNEQKIRIFVFDAYAAGCVGRSCRCPERYF